MIKIVDASNPVALIKTFIKIPPENKLVVSNAVFHTGRLLHAFLWAHSKASVLPTSWSRNSRPTLGLIRIYDLPRNGEPVEQALLGLQQVKAASTLVWCHYFGSAMYQKNHKNTLKNEANLYRISPCVRVRNFTQKGWNHSPQARHLNPHIL